MMEDIQESLERITGFNPEQLSRRAELGAKFAFDDAIPSAQRLINIFSKVPLEALGELSTNQKNVLKQQADQIFNRFSSITNFDETSANAVADRQTILTQLEGSYDGVFDKLSPIISYSVARTVDYKRLEDQGRATIQSITDKTEKVVKALENAQTQADEALSEVRTAAAEQGVSQQAAYFKMEADAEQKKATEWQTSTLRWSIALGCFGVASIFSHKWAWLAPTNIAEGIAFTAGKLAIFGALLYMLVLSARNFLSHKHNATVNRHRQNGLQTFQVLVKAGTTEATQDIILSHAASAIFAPQDTGYTKPQNTQNSQSTGLIDLAIRAASRTPTASS